MTTPDDTQPQTAPVDLDPVTDRALLEELSRTVVQGFHQVQGTLLDFGQRLGRVEAQAKDLEARMGRSSERVRGESTTNAAQDAAIANILERVGGVETELAELGKKADVQTQILTRLETGATALVKNPRVQLVAGVLWTALLGYLASKGLIH